MELPDGDLAKALRKLRAAWRVLNPGASDSEMPAGLKAAAEEREEFVMMTCPFCLSEVARGSAVCPACQLSYPQAKEASESLHAALPASGPATVRFLMPAGVTSEKTRVATAALQRSLAERVAKPRTRARVYQEIERLAADRPEPTKQQRIAALVKERPELAAQYERAVETPPAVKAPAALLSLSEAKAVMASNPRKRSAVWQVVEAKARALTEANTTLTKHQAVAQVAREDPELYRAYEMAR